MERFSDCAVYAQDFKCFGAEPQGFARIRRLNLIIGRNNTGKSALLDLVRYAIEPYELTPYSHKHRISSVVSMYGTLDEDLVKKCFSNSTSGGGIPGRSHLDYGMGFVGARMRIELTPDGKRSGQFSIDKEYVQGAQQYFERAAKSLTNPFAGLRYARIAAERDIVPEPDSPDLDLAPDGAGATNLIQRVINDERLPSELIEEQLRSDLNRIMGPDANFTRVAAQRTDGDKWMIYLDEKAKGRIALADSGSGLKTILLVLLNMLVLPALEGKDSSKYAFAFEELENNLHPGLQRRLLKYIQDKLAGVSAVAFITTHSPAVIDMFSRGNDAQILHVIHDGQAARVLEVVGSEDGHGVLDDLDVKASDLLQANGVVWVEGISDVIYLRRWIELLCHQEGLPVPVEGSEYAFMEYGGRCLSHLDFETVCAADLPAEDAKWLLPALSVSRNSYVVMDSDKRGGTSHVNATKLAAAEAAGGHWMTEGREIENYVSPEVAAEVFGKALGKYDSAAEVHKSTKGSKLDKKKAAVNVAAKLDSDNWQYRDLAEQVRLLVQTISGWNPVYAGE